jgi:cyclopropane-fatty-acyl-phospholipid synthase
LLRPQGMMLLQSITIADHHFSRYRKAVDFIQRYIFPGGFLPSVGTLAERLGRSTDFRLFHLDDLGPHYAATLRHWRRNLLDRARHLIRIGYPEALIRRFDYYFAYCESGFHERRTGLVQMLLTRPLCRRDPVLALAR